MSQESQDGRRRGVRRSNRTLIDNKVQQIALMEALNFITQQGKTYRLALTDK